MCLQGNGGITSENALVQPIGEAVENQCILQVCSLQIDDGWYLVNSEIVEWSRPFREQTFQLSWKLRASSCDMFLTRKSLNKYQGFDEPSASGTAAVYVTIPQDIYITILAFDDSHKV